MSVANSTPSSPQQDLTALACRIRDAHQAIGGAMRNALRMALDGGDALIEARSLVAADQWGRWLRDNCFLSTRTAQLYVQLAHHRQDIEAEMSRMADLSLRAARRLIAKPRTDGVGKKALRFNRSASLANLWAAASPEERTAFLAEIALTDVLAVMPASWKIEIERRVVGNLAARSDAKTKPAIQKLVADARHLGMEPTGSMCP
jgi:hypothetical protein